MTWNANGVQRDKYLLPTFLQQHDIDILLITETHLKPNQRFHISKYITYRTDGPNAPHGGVAILIKSAIT